MPKYHFQWPIYRDSPCDECGCNPVQLRWPVRRQWAPTPEQTAQQKFAAEWTREILTHYITPIHFYGYSDTLISGETLTIPHIGGVSVNNYTERAGE